VFINSQHRLYVVGFFFLLFDVILNMVWNIVIFCYYLSFLLFEGSLFKKVD